MKRTPWALTLLGALFLAYLAGSGWFVAKVAGSILTVSDTREERLAPAPSSPFELGYRGDPRAAFGLAFEDVTIETELGPAPAWLVPAEGSSATAAIYVHGIMGHREDGYRHLSVLHAAGVPVLLITYRNDAGAPLSSEKQYAFGLTEWKDLDAAVTFLTSRGTGKIILVGESMGGAIVGQFLMNSRQSGRIAALVLDSPALDGRAVIRRLAHGMRLPLASWIEPVALRILALRQPVALDKAVSLEAVASFPGPLFIAHGTGDRIVPSTISDRVVTARFGATTYLKTHADHLRSWHENPQAYRRELMGFLAMLQAR